MIPVGSRIRHDTGLCFSALTAEYAQERGLFLIISIQESILRTKNILWVAIVQLTVGEMQDEIGEEISDIINED